MYALSSWKGAKAAFVLTAVSLGVWFTVPSAAKGTEPLPDWTVVLSQSIYERNCAECHGTDGRARTAKGKRAGATDFTSDWNRDEARGIRIITNGRDEMPS